MVWQRCSSSSSSSWYARLIACASSPFNVRPANLQQRPVQVILRLPVHDTLAGHQLGRGMAAARKVEGAHEEEEAWNFTLMLI